MLISRTIAKGRIAKGVRPSFFGAWGLVAAVSHPYRRLAHLGDLCCAVRRGVYPDPRGADHLGPLGREIALGRYARSACAVATPKPFRLESVASTVLDHR